MPAPTVPIRLSKHESQLIYPGLALVCASHALWRTTGELAMADPVLYSRPTRAGRYEPAIANIIGDVKTVFRAARFGRSRLHLSAFDLAICIFAARLTARRVRHGHLRRWRKRQEAGVKRLLSKLEIYRKRAKRAFIAENGSAAYGEACRCWQAMLLFVRTHLVFCSCGRPKYPGMRKYYQRTVNDCCATAAEGLAAIGCSVPPTPELRRLVKLALAHVRRGRADFGVRTLLAYRSFAQRFLITFIQQRMREPEAEGMAA